MRNFLRFSTSVFNHWFHKKLILWCKDSCFSENKRLVLQIFFKRYKANRFSFCADNLFIRQARETNKTAFVHNPLKLPGGFEELAGGILVAYLLGDDMSSAEGGKVALLPVAVLGCLGQEQVAGVMEEWSLIEVALETAREETHLLLLQVRAVALLDELVLLVHDTIGGQDLDCLYPRRMDSGTV